jgi:hypothetical protein
VIDTGALSTPGRALHLVQVIGVICTFASVRDPGRTGINRLQFPALVPINHDLAGL